MSIFIKRFVFRPPNPPTYNIDIAARTVLVPCECQIDQILRGDIDDSVFEFRIGHKKETNFPLEFIRKPNGRRIASVFLKHDNSDKVIIYSHGNADDLGVAVKAALVLAHTLKVSVLCYDYSGYGYSEGSPSESNTYSDIRAAYDHVRSKGYISRDIILMGWSVGSGPTIELAKRLRNNVGGVILAGAFTSVFGVVHRQLEKFCPLNMFSNEMKIGDIRAPIFIIHGEADNMIPVSHGRRLHQAAGNNAITPLFIPAAGHENLYCKPFNRVVISRCREALRQFAAWNVEDDDEWGHMNLFRPLMSLFNRFRSRQ